MRYNYFVIQIVAVLFLLLLQSSCSKKIVDPGLTTSTTKLPAQIKSTVILLDQNSVQAELKSVSATSLVFTQGSSIAKAAQVGSVLVADTSTRLPYGILRKVTQRNEQNGLITLTVVNASLSDVFNEADIHFQKELFSEDFAGGRKAPGDPLKVDLKYTFKDQSGAPSKAYIEGNLQLQPAVEFIWKTKDGNLSPDEIKLRWTGKTSASLSVHLGSVTLGDKVPVKVIPGKLLRFFVYGIPIIIRYDFIIYAALQVITPQDVAVGATLHKDADVALHYQLENWALENNSKDATVDYITPAEMKGKAEFKVSIVNPVLEIHPYDIDAAKLETGFDLGFNATLSCDSKPNFDAGGYLRWESGMTSNFSAFNGALKASPKLSVDLLPADLLRKSIESVPGCKQDDEPNANALTGTIYISKSCDYNGSPPTPRPNTVSYGLKFEVKNDMSKYKKENLFISFLLPGGENGTGATEMGRSSKTNELYAGIYSQESGSIFKLPDPSSSSYPFLYSNSTPITMDMLPMGKYKIILSYKHYQTATINGQQVDVLYKVTRKVVELPISFDFNYANCGNSYQTSSNQENISVFDF